MFPGVPQGSQLCSIKKIAGLVFLVDLEQFYQALGFECLCVHISKQSPTLTTIQQDGGYEWLLQSELGSKSYAATSPNPVQPGHCCCRCCGCQYLTSSCHLWKAYLPGILKLFTSISCTPFMQSSALSFPVVLTMTLLLSLLIFIWYAIALPRSLFVESCNLLLLPVIMSMSSA